jgi:hypothetical protein
MIPHPHSVKEGRKHGAHRFRKNIESPAASGFHLPKKYLRPRLPISTADGFSLAPLHLPENRGGGGETMDASPCSVAGSARTMWFGSSSRISMNAWSRPTWFGSSWRGGAAMWRRRRRWTRRSWQRGRSGAEEALAQELRWREGARRRRRGLGSGRCSGWRVHGVWRTVQWLGARADVAHV